MVYMNNDPVYSCGVGRILNFVFLMHVRNGMVTVVRRILVLFVLYFWTTLLTYQVTWYFDPPLMRPSLVTVLQSFGISMWYKDMLGLGRFNSMYASITFDTSIRIITHLLFIFPIVFDCRDIATILSWDEGKTSLGKYMLNQGSRNSQLGKANNVLHENLVRRFQYLINKDFWRYINLCSRLPDCVSKSLFSRSPSMH